MLSAFEESSAACISDMLRQVMGGHHLDAIRMAEKFVLHVEVLFGTIDDLEYCSMKLNLKSILLPRYVFKQFPLTPMLRHAPCSGSS